MGILTCAELIEEVRLAHASRTDLSDARIVRALNLAISTVAKLYNPDELEDHLDLPTGLTAGLLQLNFSSLSPYPKKIISATIQSGDGRDRKLIGFSERQFNAAFPKPDFDARNIPWCYVKFARSLRFYPVPDQTYRLYLSIQRTPVKLNTTTVGLTTVSDLDAPDTLTIYWANHYLFNSFQEHEKAKEFQGLFQQAAKDAHLGDDRYEPDQVISSERAYLGRRYYGGEPWNDPFYDDSYW